MRRSWRLPCLNKSLSPPATRPGLLLLKVGADASGLRAGHHEMIIWG
jgi:hypothetical protein